MTNLELRLLPLPDLYSQLFDEVSNLADTAEGRQYLADNAERLAGAMVRGRLCMAKAAGMTKPGTLNT
jgi:hypothetical protein